MFPSPELGACLGPMGWGPYGMGEHTLYAGIGQFCEDRPRARCWWPRIMPPRRAVIGAHVTGCERARFSGWPGTGDHGLHSKYT